MPRVKRGKTARERHKKILHEAKGYWGARSRLYKTAKEAVERARQYAYRDRRVRKRDFRRLWIARINAAARQNGMTYGRFIEGLTKAGVQIDRKILAEMAVNDQDAFAALIQKASEHVSA